MSFLLPIVAMRFVIVLINENNDDDDDDDDSVSMLLGGMGEYHAGVRVSRTLAQGHGPSVLHGRQSRLTIHRAMQYHHVLLRERVEGAASPRQDQDRQQQRQRQVGPARIPSDNIR